MGTDGPWGDPVLLGDKFDESPSRFWNIVKAHVVVGCFRPTVGGDVSDL